MALTGAMVRETAREAALWEGLRTEPSTLASIIEASGRRLGGRRSDPQYLEKFAEASDFLADVLDGRRPVHYLEEALSTSDFPLLMGDILDRQLLGRYTEMAPVYRNYCKVGTVRDFRTVRRIATDGLEGRYCPTSLTPELAQAKENNSLAETGYTYAVDVYEKRVALNWRMLVNDDLDAFRDIPDRLARGARRTEQYFASQLYVDANGPHASLFTVGNRNIVNATNAGAGFTAVNPPLSIAAVQQGFAVFGNLRDADGEPIEVEAVELVVPPSLRVTAENILNATELWITSTTGDTMGGGSAAQQAHVSNWMKAKTRLSVDPYIPIVASSANGTTSWFLFANPDSGRPAVEIGFLRGYESPGLYQKLPDTVRVGSSTPEMMLGSFETGELQYKGMHIIGGTRMDPKAAVASNGSGA
jgi:hypothetical protein